jgi:hypothetical protein
LDLSLSTKELPLPLMNSSLVAPPIRQAAS